MEHDGADSDTVSLVIGCARHKVFRTERDELEIRLGRLSARGQGPVQTHVASTVRTVAAEHEHHRILGRSVIDACEWRNRVADAAHHISRLVLPYGREHGVYVDRGVAKNDGKGRPDNQRPHAVERHSRCP